MGNLAEVVQGLKGGKLYVSQATFLFLVSFCFEKHKITCISYNTVSPVRDDE